MISWHNLNKAKSLHITGRSREIIFINTYIENQYVYLEFLVSSYPSPVFQNRPPPNIQSECQVDNLLTYRSFRIAFC